MDTETTITKAPIHSLHCHIFESEWRHLKCKAVCNGTSVTYELRRLIHADMEKGREPVAQ